MTKEELLEDLERRAVEAEAIGAMAPVSALLRSLHSQLTDLDGVPTAQKPDRLLAVADAAERMAVTERWIYDNRHTLPFVKRLSSKQIRVSERGLERWLASR